MVSNEMDGEICSTGFTVVRPGDGIVSAYLHTALRLHTTLEQFGRRSSGTSYHAIRDKDVKETLVPVPSRRLQE